MGGEEQFAASQVSAANASLTARVKSLETSLDESDAARGADIDRLHRLQKKLDDVREVAARDLRLAKKESSMALSSLREEMETEQIKLKEADALNAKLTSYVNHLTKEV